MSTPAPPPKRTRAPSPVANWEAYDFIDLGAGSGGSIRHCSRRFKARGIGIERSLKRVNQAREAGIEVIHGDGALFDCEKVVRFVTMMDMLEHLPDLNVVEIVLAKAIKAARQFIFIRHPSFEGEERARQRNYVVGHWREGFGHTAHIMLSDFAEMFARLGVGPVTVNSVEPIRHTSHEVIMGIDGDKPDEAIDPPLWRRHDIFVQIAPMPADEWESITKPLSKEYPLGVHRFVLS
ncbi:class I SAM-dependent methyltransferase [Reyranella sp.]|uniref:class I SAM-dependent methyltransferase n=1 Tax=Reyranella sp. TaxID=1929291 RepID=UPI003D123340